jgi:hypothetical protein
MNITVAISLSYQRDDMINVIIEDMIGMSNGALILPFQIASAKWNTTTLSILDLVRGRHHATYGSTEKLHEKGQLLIEKYLNIIIKTGQLKNRTLSILATKELKIMTKLLFISISSRYLKIIVHSRANWMLETQEGIN